MPFGVVVNGLSVLFGGLIGGFLGEKIPKRLRVALPLTFGVASMGMGINYIVKLNTLPAVILSLILGSAIGELIRLEDIIKKVAQRARGPIEKLFSGKKNESGEEVIDTEDNQNAFLEKFVGILILFCASGTGIFGALNEGMTGDHVTLFTKSILDFLHQEFLQLALDF